VRDKVVAEAAREKKTAAARAALQQVLAVSNTAAELEANAAKAGLSSTFTDWFAPFSEPIPEALAGAGDLPKDLSALSAKAPFPERSTRRGKEIPSPWRFPASGFPPTRSGRKRSPAS